MFKNLYLLDAQRKLAFLNKEGYDIYGKNEFFAPRVKWNVLEEEVEETKEAAQAYETSFNNVMKIKNVNENFQQVSVPNRALTYGTELNRYFYLSVRAREDYLSWSR